MKWSITFRAITLQAAADIKMSPLFEANATTQGLGFYFDAFYSNDYYQPVPNKNFPYALREGNGLRLSLVAFDVDLKSTVSVGAVAAEANLRKTKVQYELTGFGLTMDLIAAVMNLKGDLSMELVADLDDIVSHKLPEMLSATGLPVMRYRVPLPSLADDVKPEVRARTVAFAMARIGSGCTLDVATHTMPAWAVENVVIATYACVAPGLDHGISPSPQQQSKANLWLSTGQIP